jgi:hypothetical protein
MKLCRNFRVPSLISLPLASNSLSALPMQASGCAIAGTFRRTSDCRRWCPNPRMPPGDAMTTAPGLLFQAFLP